MFVVAVQFKLKEGAYAAFREIVIKNARASIKEPNCRQFDVSFSADQTQCFLYEVYTHRAAWDVEHHGTEHFKAFAAAHSPLVLSKQLDLYERDDS